MNENRDSNNVRDTVGIRVEKCGDVIMSRTATYVGAGMPSTDPTTVNTYFRLVLDRIVEFSDVNDDGVLNDGDTVRSFVDVTTLTCSYTRNPVTVSGQTCDTVTFVDSAGVFTLTFTLCSPGITIGTRSVPQRASFEVLEIHYPYSRRDSKLAVIFNAFAKNIGDTFSWNSAGVLLLNNGPGGNKGSLTFDLNARVGDASIPLNFQLYASTTDADSISKRLATENKSAKLVVSVDAFAPFPLVIDPFYQAGFLSASAQTSISVLVLLFAAMLLVIIQQF